jgi:histidinol-phosphate phosphatase family protein
MQAVILAGGKGTRLRARLGDLPKPMVDICGKPLLQWQIELVRSHGCQNILLLLGYNPDSIINYFGDGEKFGVSISYVTEKTPLGSAGAVLAAFDQLEDRFVVLYGDTALNVDLGRFINVHASSGCQVSLFVHPNDHPQDSDLVEADESGRVQAFHSYPHQAGRYYGNLVNAALYVVEKSGLEQWRDVAVPLDFAKDLFPKMLTAGQHLFSYRSREYIKDAGTPERLERVEADLLSGRIARSSLGTPAGAIFLDRDGTINEEVGRISDPDQLQLLPGAASAIRRLNRAGYPVVVVSNQPVIARGDCTEATLRLITNKMESLLGEEGSYVDAVYYCPHHPDSGFAGERPELKFVCSCRKPATGLIDNACREMNLDPASSWLIGDSAADMKAAANAGIRSVLVETGLVGKGPLEDCVANHRVASLVEAVDYVLGSTVAQ